MTDQRRLCDVPVGAVVVVHSVAVGDAGQGRRLEDLGVIAGTVVRVERRAPLGDPTIYEVRNALLAIRRHDAELVDVELVDVELVDVELVDVEPVAPGSDAPR